MEEQYLVVDTNIYLLDAIEAIHSFAPKHDDVTNHIIIPYVVLEEIDKFKTEIGTSRGHNARLFSNELKRLRKETNQSLHSGIQLGERHTLRVCYEYNNSLEQKLQAQMDSSKEDNIILAITETLREQNKQVELVTNDSNLYVKADALGIKVSDWQAVRSLDKYEDIYKGWRQIEVDEKTMDAFLGLKKAGLPVDEFNIDTHPKPNEYFYMTISGSEFSEEYKHNEQNNTRDFALGMYIQDQEGPGRIIPVHKRIGKENQVLGIKARNIQQSFALDALLRQGIKLVNLIGPAGTGKTILSVAAGLNQLNAGNPQRDLTRYDSILISRPLVSMGEEIGFLPGSIEEKMTPWMRPIFDNITGVMAPEILKRITKSPKERNAIKGGDLEDYLLGSGLMELQPLSFIRGRSIENGFLIIDESQNIDPLEAKTIITRASEGTKVVMTGDPEQIDKKGLTELTNGVTYSSERLKDENITATVFLPHGERSELATIAAKNL